jgi:hypothetical protein
MDNIKIFIEKHLNKLIGSSGAIGIMQFVSQLQDYLSDGTLDDHEIVSLLMSLSSALQAIILVAVLAYLKLKKSNEQIKKEQKGNDESSVQ